jgi:Transposase
MEQYAGIDVSLELETRHVKAAMSVKTDRNDARGIAQLIRMGWFRPVHVKSVGSREVRALLVARKQLLSKLMDLEASMRGILRGFGLKMGVVTRKGFEARVRDLSAGQAILERLSNCTRARSISFSRPQAGADQRLGPWRPGRPFRAAGEMLARHRSMGRVRVSQPAAGGKQSVPRTSMQGLALQDE